MPSEQSENYLKNICKLQETEGRVSTSLLSEKLGISAASVTEMIKRLADDGLLKYTPYRGVELTEKGRKRALRIIRRHRLWELFLVEVLKYGWDEIDEEAERLEHITSEKLEQRLDAALGHPRIDPHGHEIPTAEGNLEGQNHLQLSAVEPGKTVTVARVSDEKPEILQYATKLGIALRKKIEVKERIDFDGSIIVQIDGKEQYISSKLAGSIFVEA